MLATLPMYLGFLGISIALMVAALGIYIMVTPYSEIALIRQGNKAAALSLGGTTIGIAWVLFSVALSTYEPLELVVWGGIGLLTQLLVFGIVCLVIPGLKRGIVEDQVSYGIILGAISIAMGILTAGAVSE